MVELVVLLPEVPVLVPAPALASVPAPPDMDAGVPLAVVGYSESSVHAGEREECECEVEGGTLRRSEDGMGRGAKLDPTLLGEY